MSHNHEMHDDCADFAVSRWGQTPGEASTEIGADLDRIGCGTGGRGLSPVAWLLISLLCVVLALLTAHFAANWWL